MSLYFSSYGGLRVYLQVLDISKFFLGPLSKDAVCETDLKIAGVLLITIKCDNRNHISIQ